MKAMILAAGRGARLSPQTDNTPKPLIQVQGRALIDWQLDRLVTAGFSDFVVNVGYLGAQIQKHLEDNPRAGVTINVSIEPESALETGGGVVNALPFLGDGPVAIVNADVWTDFDFRRLKRLSTMSHNTSWHGHLVLVPNPSHNTTGDFGLANGWINTLVDATNGSATSDVRQQSYTFSGISVLSTELFRHLSPGKFPLAPILTAAARENLLSGEIHSSLWSDIGTAERLNEINGLKIPFEVRTKV